MYSIVLATMLTAGGEAPAFGHGCRGGCGGCFGGNAFSSCHGCYSYGCAGSCYGYSGSCYGCWGSYSYGCSGSCHGCWGSYSQGSYVGCHGCYGCYGSCHGSYTNFYHGCSSPYNSCHGGIVVSPQAPYMPPAPKTGSVGNAATVVVEMPANSTLFIDDQKTPITATPYSIVTPALEPGKKYFYSMKVETTHEGKTISDTKKVEMEAGKTVRVDFREMTASTPAEKAALKTAKSAKVTVKLPEDAKLYIDDVPSNLTSATRTFETPTIETGRAYYYVLKAEVVRDGETKTEKKQVIFEAGKEVTVEFTGLTSVSAARR